MDLGRSWVLTLGGMLLILAAGCSLGRGRGTALANSSRKAPMVVASRSPSLPVPARTVGLSTGPESPLDRNSADRAASPRPSAPPVRALTATTARDNVRLVPRWDEPDRRLPEVEETQDVEP